MIQEWEYKVLAHDYHTGKSIEPGLNALGAEGWELISLNIHPKTAEAMVTFKRPKE